MRPAQIPIIAPPNRLPGQSESGRERMHAESLTGQGQSPVGGRGGPLGISKPVSRAGKPGCKGAQQRSPIADQAGAG